MQLIAKTIKGRKYWYLVEKGRKDGVVTNVRTIYLGPANRLADRLVSQGATQFPVAFDSFEMGASAALFQEVAQLDLVSLLDQACGARRFDAALSYGQLLTVLAIQRAIAPRPLKSMRQVEAFYRKSGLCDLWPLAWQGLDARRLDEALELLRAEDLTEAEQLIVAKMVQVHKLSLDSLCFDATNFDSYAQADNPSRLLRRGHAKSKRVDLRLLGLGLLVTADEGLPLLSFTYPGNLSDTTSFGSFLRRLKVRKKALSISAKATVVCDGGNISKERVEQLEHEQLGHVVRLPFGHAPQADALSTQELPEVVGEFEGQVRAKKLVTPVYGKPRIVVAVYSAAMHHSQVPGLARDLDRATQELEQLKERLNKQNQGTLCGKPLTVEKTRGRVEKILSRQHIKDLFSIEVSGQGAEVQLSSRFLPNAYQDLTRYRLGRTVILTDHADWDEAQILHALREQSHEEDAFRQLKDPEWASAVPLRHQKDPMLRVHTFIAVLALLLSKLVVRRLHKAGIQTTVNEALWQLSELRLARLVYGKDASPELKALAEKQRVPPVPNELQGQMIQALGLRRALRLGPTKRPLKKPSPPTAQAEPRTP
jgi:transposase